MKITESELRSIIRKSLITETTLITEGVTSGWLVNLANEQLWLSEKAKKSFENAVKHWDAGEEIFGKLFKDLPGSDGAIQKAAEHFLEKHGIISPGFAGTVFGLFGAASMTVGTFSILPSMIASTIKGLNSIPGKIINIWEKSIGNAATKDGCLMRARGAKNQLKYPCRKVEWSHISTNRNEFGKIAELWGVNALTTDQIITAIAISPLVKKYGNTDLVKTINDLGTKRARGATGVVWSEDHKGFDGNVMAPSLLKRIWARRRKLRKDLNHDKLRGNLANALKDAFEYKDKNMVMEFLSLSKKMGGPGLSGAQEIGVEKYGEYQKEKRKKRSS